MKGTTHDLPHHHSINYGRSRLYYLAGGDILEEVNNGEQSWTPQGLGWRLRIEQRPCTCLAHRKVARCSRENWRPDHIQATSFRRSSVAR